MIIYKRGREYSERYEYLHHVSCSLFFSRHRTAVAAHLLPLIDAGSFSYRPGHHYSTLSARLKRALLQTARPLLGTFGFADTQCQIRSM
jgi:hypothetical protein